MRSSFSVLGLIGLLGLLAGLCAVLILVVAVSDAWREHAVESWPEAPATIERCSVDLRYYNGPDDDDPTWLLECPIHFRAGTQEIATTLHSGYRSNPAKGYPGVMNQWADDHPSGSSVVIRYNPTDPSVAMPATDYMPNAGPRTRFDLLFLLVLSSACVGLLTIVRLFRRRTAS